MGGHDGATWTVRTSYRIGQGIMFGALCVEAAFTVRDHHQTWARVVSVVGIIICALAYWAGAWRPRLTLTSDGLTVVNPVRSIHLRASDIESVSPRSDRRRYRDNPIGSPLFIVSRGTGETGVFALRGDSLLDLLLRRPPRQDQAREQITAHLEMIAARLTG